MTGEVYSLGFLCERLQRSPREVRVMLQELHATPAIVLNDVDHYDGALLEALLALIRLRNTTISPRDRRYES